MTDQIRKNKTKLAKRLRDDVLENYEVSLGGDDVKEDKDEFKIIKVKRVSAKPVMTEEATFREYARSRFLYFTNPDSGDTNIVYRRKDGNYALIEAD